MMKSSKSSNLLSREFRDNSKEKDNKMEHESLQQELNKYKKECKKLEEKIRML